MPALLQVAVIALAVAITSQSRTEMNPLRLQVEEQGEATTVRVVGFAEEPCSVVYVLQVADGRNRSTQRGVATLKAGTLGTVATVRLLSSGPLSARLTVKPCNSREYEETFST